MWDVLAWFGDKEVQAKKDYRHAREIATSDPECKWTESALVSLISIIDGNMGRLFDGELVKSIGCGSFAVI